MPIRVFAGELIFAQSIDGRSIFGPSSKAPSGAQNAEEADDFDLIASIDRVAAIGYTSGPAADSRGVTSGNANLSTKGARGTYKLTVTNTSKTGYTFDAANSVLTKSITK